MEYISTQASNYEGDGKMINWQAVIGFCILSVLLVGVASAASDQISSNSMTSNSTDGYTANRSTAAQNTYVYEAWYAFDGDNGDNGWQSTSRAATGSAQWVGQSLPVPKTLSSYTMYGFSATIYRPTAWTVEGSNNGFSGPWTVLDTRSGVTSWNIPTEGMVNYDLTGTEKDSYKYFRVNFTASAGDQMIVNEIWLYGGTTTPIASFASTNLTPVTNTTSTMWAATNSVQMQFNDTSVFAPTSLAWRTKNTAGNNTWVLLGNSKNITHTFGVGNWSVNLTASNSAGSNISTQVTWVNVSPPISITANFTPSNSSGIQPLLVQFTDTSMTVDATIDSWAWDFGDGNASALQSPSHTYDVPGTHTANLTITNTSYSLTSTKLVTISVYKQPVADFSSFNTQGTAPFTTYFYDTSTNLNAGPYTYYTEFGDGNTSTEQFALHTYNMTGSFTVKHSVTDSVTAAWKNVTGYITVGSPVVAPIASFYGGPQLGAPPMQVFFTDVSSNTPTGWNWSFGDGTFSESQNPAHWFNRSGLYRVNLTATNSAGSNLTSQSNFVVVY